MLCVCVVLCACPVCVSCVRVLCACPVCVSCVRCPVCGVLCAVSCVRCVSGLLCARVENPWLKYNEQESCKPSKHHLHHLCGLVSF